MFFNPGTVLNGRYVINKILGHGGMGAVYLATHVNLGTEWAVKQLLDLFGSDADSQDEKLRAIEQFNIEAKMLARLDHINLPRVIDFFDDSGSYFLVMEFIKGKTLGEVERENIGFLPVDKVLSWSVQLCNVLDYLHNQKPHPIIFRDLKPENIMVTGDNTIKLIDFGIAKIFNPASHTGTIIRGTGTLAFCPPEQYGTAGTDPRSDIYSLGATMYVLLTKQKCPVSIDRLINKSPLPSMKKSNPNVTSILEQCIFKAMELDRENRYQTVLDMKKDLEMCTEINQALIPDDIGAPSPSSGFSLQSSAFWDIHYPHSIALDVTGNIYVSDKRNIIQKFDGHGNLISKWHIITEKDTSSNPSIAVDSSGNLYTLMMECNYVEKFDANGSSVKKWGGKGSNDGEFVCPCDITVGDEDNIYIVDTGNNRIQKFDSSGNFIITWGQCGVEKGQFNYPRGITVDSFGNIYVADTGNCLIQKFDGQGNFIINWGGRGTGKGQFKHPLSVIWDQAGYVYVIDDWLDNIQKFDLWGNFISSLDRNIFIDDNFIALSDGAVDAAGNVYLVNKGKHIVQKFSSDGTFITKWGNPDAVSSDR